MKKIICWWFGHSWVDPYKRNPTCKRCKKTGGLPNFEHMPPPPKRRVVPDVTSNAS